MTLAEAAKARVEKAREKLLAAKTDSDRAKALVAFEAATEAATKYKKKVVEEEEETDDDDDEEEEEEESSSSDSEESEESKSEESDDDGDDDKDEDDEEDEKSTKKAHSILSSKTTAYTYQRLFKLALQTARAHTGRQHLSVKQVFDALESSSSLAADVRQMKLDARRRDVDLMLATACRERRITPAEKNSLRDIGMQRPKWLKAHLATRAPVVRGVDEGEIPPNAAPGAYERAAKGSARAKGIAAIAAAIGKKPEDIQIEENSR